MKFYIWKVQGILINEIEKIVLTTSVVLGTVTASFAADNDIDTSVDVNSVNTADMVVSNGSVKTSYDSNYILKPFASTWGAITNRDDTWGSQDRTGTSGT